jgi:hypothetical protein
MKISTRDIKAFLLGITMIVCSSAYGQSDTADEIVDFSFRLQKDTIDLEKGIPPNWVRGNLTATPNDTTYHIEGLEVYLKRGSEAKAQVKGDGARVSVGTITAVSPKKGDFLVVKVTAISRANSKGVKERISTRGMIWTIEIK